MNETFARYDDMQQAHEEHEVPLEGQNLEKKFDTTIPKNLRILMYQWNDLFQKLQHPNLKDFPHLCC